MCLRGGVPGERVAGALGAGARRGERARVLEQLPESPGERLDVVRQGRLGRPRSARRPRRARRRRRRPPGRRLRAPGAAPRTGRAPRGRGRRRRSPPRAPARAPRGRDTRAAIRRARRPVRAASSRGMRGSPATSRRASGRSRTASTASERPLYGRITPSERTVRPSSRRGGSLRKTGCGITASRSGATPNPASVARPRSECTTTRSNRAKSDLHVRVRRAVRRGSRSCAVKTSGVCVRSSARSTSGAASHWKCSTSAFVRDESAHPPRMLERAYREAQSTALDAARARVEGLLEPVAVGRGTGAESKRRRDEIHGRTGPRERRGELVVVRRSERGWIGEHDVHRADRT